MKENWKDFFDMLIGHEGGFTDDVHDSGNKKGDGHGNEGSTMWGVTAWNWAHYTGKPAPKEVMKALKKEDVEEFIKNATGMQCLEIYFRLVFAFRFAIYV